MKKLTGLVVLTVSTTLALSLVLAVLGRGPMASFFLQDPAGWKVPAVQLLLPLLVWLMANGAALGRREKVLSPKWLALVPAGFLVYRMMMGYISYYPEYGFSRLLLLPLAWVGYRRFAGRASAGFLAVAGVLFFCWLGAFPYPWAWLPSLVGHGAVLIGFILPHAVALAGWWRGTRSATWRGITVFASLLVAEAVLAFALLPWLGQLVLMAALALAVLAILVWQAIRLVKSLARRPASVRLLASVLIGAIVASAALALPGPAADTELSPEEEIYVAIFLHGIRFDQPAYISVDGQDNDPSSALLAALTGLHVPVYGISRAQKDITGVWDKLTLRRGVHYSVRGLEWVGDNSVQVEFTYFQAGLAAAGYRVELVRTSRGWQVKNEQMIWMS